MTISNCQVDKITLRVPFPASTAISVGDLLWWDNVNKVGNSAANRPDQGSLLLNQEDFAPLFLGVSADQRLSTETSVTGTAATGPGDRTVIAEGEFDATCQSQTWEYGDLVSVDRNTVTPASYNQQVNKVTGAAAVAAIGYVIKREPVAVTKVRVFLSSYTYGWFKTRGALASGTWYSVGANANDNITNTNAATAFATTATIPAASLQVGDVIHIKAVAVVTGQTANATQLFSVKILTAANTYTALGSTAATNAANGATAVIEADVIVTAVGASGAFDAVGTQFFGATGNPSYVQNQLATAINTNTAITIECTATCNAASTSNVIQLIDLEANLKRA